MKIANSLGGPPDFPACLTIVMRCAINAKYDDEVASVHNLFQKYLVALGGVLVSVLATGPKVRGFKPGRGRWILRVIKSIARLSSEGK
jgi:hypothetical protein